MTAATRPVYTYPHIQMDTIRRLVPLRKREAGQEEQYLGPYESVPDWLFPALWEWFVRQVPRLYVSGGYSSQTAEDEYRSIALFLRLNLDHKSSRVTGPVTAEDMSRNLHTACQEDPELLLEAIDFVLLAARDHRTVESLNLTLILGGSVWEAVRDNGGYKLHRRTTQEARQAVELMATRGTAGRYLARAWDYAYRREPNPNEAYGEAVKAVEAAAKPLISPKNDTTTLGTLIRDLNQAPNKWAVVLPGEDRDGQVRAVSGAMALLWRAHHRHGSDDEVREHTLAEAEAAVHLAAWLVQWFNAGAITAREGRASDA